MLRAKDAYDDDDDDDILYIYTDKTTKHGPSAQFAKKNRAIVQGATVGALSASVTSMG